MAFVALAEVFRLRGRVLLVITALAAFLLFWPGRWGGDRLGLNELRDEPFLWVIGAIFVGFAGLSLTRLVDWLDARRNARRQFDNVLLELRSRQPAERELLAQAITSGSSTVEVDWSDREHAEVLVSKGLLEKVVEPKPLSYGASRPGRYTVPTTVWNLMRGKDPKTFFEEIEENRGKFVRELMLGSLFGPRIDIQVTAEAVEALAKRLKAMRKPQDQEAEPPGPNAPNP